MQGDPELNLIYKIEAEVIVKKEMDRDELKTLKKQKRNTDKRKSAEPSTQFKLDCTWEILMLVFLLYSEPISI